MSWKESILELFDVFGPASLAVISATEAIIQPVPPDVVYIPMLLNNIGQTEVVIGLWLVITLSSVFGSLIGYWIGQKWGRSLVTRFGAEAHVQKLRH